MAHPSACILQLAYKDWCPVEVKDVRPFCLTCTWTSDEKTGDLQCGFTRCWQKFLPPVMPGCATNQVTETELKDPPKRRGGYFWLDQWSHLPCSPTGRLCHADKEAACFRVGLGVSSWDLKRFSMKHSMSSSPYCELQPHCLTSC